ncbi:MAG: hypothetical protein ACKVS6_13330, partial [Planctomycetota bacterium]
RESNKRRIASFISFAPWSTHPPSSNAGMRKVNIANRVGVTRAQRASVRGLTGLVSPSAAVVQARLYLLILRRHGYAREHA